MGNIEDRIDSICTEYIQSRAFSFISSDSFLDGWNELLLFTYLSNGGNNPDIINVLQSYTYQEGIISKEDEAILVTNYRDTVEFICNDIAKYPEELTTFTIEYFKAHINNCANNKNITIYTPFSGLCSLAVKMPDAHFTGEEADKVIWAISQIRLHAYNITAEIVNEDSLNNIQNHSRKYNYIVCAHSFGIADYPEEKIISDLYEKLENGGSMAIVVTSSFLVNTKTRHIWTRLVKDCSMKALYLMPDGLFKQTPAGCALLIIEKREKEKQNYIYMADATFAVRNNYNALKTLDIDAFVDAVVDGRNSPVDRIVYVSSIIKKKHLNPKLYLLDGLKDGIGLETLATFQKDDIISNISCKLIETHNLSSEFPRTAISTDKIQRKETGSDYCHKISEPCLLLAIRQDTVLVGFIEHIENDLCVSNNISILIPKNGISLRYLALLLLSPYVKKELCALSIGCMLPLSSRSDVKDIIVPRHSEKEQDNLVQEALMNSMTNAEKESEQKQLEYYREIRSRKHALSQNVSAFSALWNALKSYRQQHNGHIEGSDIIGKIHRMSVNDIFTTLDSMLETLMSQTEHLADIEYRKENSVNIDPQQFIEEYIKGHRHPNYSLLHSKRNNHAETDIVSTENGRIIRKKGESITTFEFPFNALVRVFDNIVSNAADHGFKNKTDKENIVYFDWYTDGHDCTITIANNGQPLSEDTDIDKIFTYGYSTVLNHGDYGHRHSGIGTYEAKNILEKEGASIEVISTPDKEYTVTYKLTFTKINSIS